MAAALLAALLIAGPAPALPLRSQEERAALTALAGGLGRAHALRQLCEGPQDDRWRAAMSRMLATEKPDPELRQRLTDSFNAGFAGAGKDYAACSPESRQALGKAVRAAAEPARRLGAGS